MAKKTSNRTLWILISLFSVLVILGFGLRNSRYEQEVQEQKQEKLAREDRIKQQNYEEGVALLGENQYFEALAALKKVAEIDVDYKDLPHHINRAEDGLKARQAKQRANGLKILLADARQKMESDNCEDMYEAEKTLLRARELTSDPGSIDRLVRQFGEKRLSCYKAQNDGLETSLPPFPPSRAVAKSGLLGAPIPSGSRLVDQYSGDPSQYRDPWEKYAVDMTVAEIRRFFDREMPKAGWRKDTVPLRNDMLFFSKGRFELGVIIEGTGRKFMLMGS